MKHTMKIYIYIAIIVVLAVACQPHNKPTPPTPLKIDTTYTEADFRKYGNYYNSDHQVYAIDLLSDSLDYDSTFHIFGSGCNLFLSDIFAPKDSTARIPAGTYTMDSTAKEMTFLRGISFDGNITGTYLLAIQEDQIKRIMLFTSGSMVVDYIDQDIVLDFNLYTQDSTRYHATYIGPARYR